MSLIEVLNVGHGDSIILRPQNDCNFKDETFIIDLGPGNCNVTDFLNADIKNNRNINIILTHHDADHMGGFKFFFDKIQCLNKLIIPEYQNEITLIAKGILSLKGIYSAVNCSEFISDLESIVNNQYFLKEFISKNHKPHIEFAHENKNLCFHITCLNPPINISTYNWLREIAPNYLIDIVREVYSPEFARAMEIYINAYNNLDRYSVVSDSPLIDEITLTESDNVDFMNNITTINKANYVISFMMNNIQLFRRFNANPTSSNLRKIYNNYIKCTHDVCIVLKIQYGENKFLLSADASKKVFKRLIQSNVDISANYFKIPHHGSIKNINYKILNKVNPDTAIISHGNRFFGKSKDSLPNMRTLEMLQEKRTNILLTNDVIKYGKIYMSKNNHCKDNIVKII